LPAKPGVRIQSHLSVANTNAGLWEPRAIGKRSARDPHKTYGPGASEARNAH
jgi:hypothetical protein